MVRLLLIVFALVLVVGLSGGGLIYFKVIPDFTGLIAQTGEGTETTGAKAAAAAAPRVAPLFIDMNPFLVPVIRNGALERNIYMSFRLKVDPANKEEVRPHLQALHDVYLRALFQMVPEQLETRDTLDVGKIKARLGALNDRVVGEGKVDDVIVSAVFER